MAYRLLVTDVDGTLVDSRQNVPEKNQRAIQRLVEAGKLFTLATGRNETAAGPYARLLGVNAPAILYNGGKVVDFGPPVRTLMEFSLSPEAAVAAIRLAEQREVRVNLYVDNKIYVKAIDPVIREYMAKDRVPCLETGDLAAFAEGLRGRRGPTKLLIIGQEEDLAALTEVIPVNCPGVSLVRSEPNYLEVLPAGVSKGAALEWLCRHLGIAVEQVVAIGDGPNDLEMIRLAGLGVAVENAHPSLKEAADYVAPSHEAGAVAEVIQRFFSL